MPSSSWFDGVSFQFLASLTPDTSPEVSPDGSQARGMVSPSGLCRFATVLESSGMVCGCSWSWRSRHAIRIIECPIRSDGSHGERRMGKCAKKVARSISLASCPLRSLPRRLLSSIHLKKAEAALVAGDCSARFGQGGEGERLQNAGDWERVRHRICGFWGGSEMGGYLAGG